MRTLIAATFVFVLPCGYAFAQPVKAIHDPWQGFGLGSMVRKRTLVEVGGKKLRDALVTYKVERVSATGSVGVWEHRVSDGDNEFATSYHVWGRDPERLGLKLESKKDSTLTIEGREIPVTVNTWISVKGKKELGKTAKLEIPKLGGPKARPSVEIKLVFYEARLPEVEIPYHEIEAAGTDISVGPRVVKAELRFTRLGDDMKPIEEHRHVETVKQLMAVYDIKGKKARCVVIEIEGSIWTEKAKSFRKWENWYSNAVPGREVKKTMVGEEPEGKVKLQMTLEEFAVRPELPKFNLAKVIADPKRARIPDPTWNNMRLGAWCASIYQSREHDQNSPSDLQVHLNQIVQIHDDGTYVSESKILTNSGWEVKEHRLVVAPPPEKAQETTERVELEVLGKKTTCDKRTRKKSDQWSRSTVSVWLPVNEAEKKLLAESGFPNLKEIQSGVTKDSIREWPWRSEGLLTSAGAETFVGGKAVRCYTYKTTNWDDDDKKPSSFKYKDGSKTLPTWTAATMYISPTGYIRTHTLDFGEAEKVVPSLDQIHQYLKQAVPAMKRIGNEKLD